MSLHLPARRPLFMGQSVFQPNDLGGLQLWLKADSLSLNDGDPVGTWTDSSGQGNDVTQATAGQKPLYKTNIRNGLPIVRFDGVDDLMNIPAAVFGGTGETVFFAGQGAGITIDRVFIGKNGPYLWFSFAAYGNVGWSPPTVAVAATTGWQLLTWLGVNELFRNGSSILTGATVHPSGAQFLCAYDSVGAGAADPDIGELLVYNSALSAANRALVENYLNGRWAVY